MLYSDSKTMEIRGIRIDEIAAYFEQIGGERSESEDSYLVISNNDWYVNISPEESFTFMHSEIPIVHFTIYAANEAILDQIVKEIRLKTFRAGG